MKLITCIIAIFFSNYINSQELTKSSIDCDIIKNGIIDKELYDTLSNGKVIYNLNLNKNKLFLIKNTENQYQYYVTKKIMRKIKKFNCNGIIIEKIKSRKSIYSPRIIRD